MMTGIPVSKVHSHESSKLKGLADELKKAVKGQDQAIEKISNIKDLPRAAKRGEIIARTELSRMHSLVHQKSTERMLMEFPQIAERIKQVFIVVSRGEWPCKICAPLQGNIYEFNDPRKPNPPTSTHPNCRCKMVNYYEGISSRARIPEPVYYEMLKAEGRIGRVGEGEGEGAELEMVNSGVKTGLKIGTNGWSRCRCC
jgi:hypothetical protein